jgi:hypothetical protein
MSYNDILDRPSLVIIIDCWSDHPGDKQISLMQNIRAFCETNLFVSAVGLASYVGLDQRVVPKEEPWYSEGKEFFYNRLRWNTLRNLWEGVTFEDHGPVQTHPMVRDMKLRSDQRQFLLWNDLQVLYYCNFINPSIENIFVIGQAWDNCLAWRSVGWQSLSNLNYYNLFQKKKTILSKKDCVLKMNNLSLDAVEDPWIELNDNIVMLQDDQWQKMSLQTAA